MAKTKPDKCDKLIVNGQEREPKRKVKIKDHVKWSDLQAHIKEIKRLRREAESSE